MKLTRRTFMAGLCAIAGGLVIGTDPVKLLADVRIPKLVTKIPYVRVLCDFDLYRDRYLVRYDMLDLASNKQFHCGMVVEDVNTVKDYIEKIHKPIESALDSYMRENNISIYTLGKLAMPSGYNHPDFMMDILKELNYKQWIGGKE